MVKLSTAKQRIEFGRELMKTGLNQFPPRHCGGKLHPHHCHGYADETPAYDEWRCLLELHEEQPHRFELAWRSMDALKQADQRYLSRCERKYSYAEGGKK